MRLTSIAATILFVAMAAPGVIAESAPAKPDPATIKNEAWGYSFAAKGLAAMPDAYNVGAFGGTINSASGSGFHVSHVKSSKGSEQYLKDMAATFVSFQKFVAEKSEDCVIAGQKALKVRLTHDGDPNPTPLMIYWVTKAAADEFFWLIQVNAAGEHFKDDAKLAEDAVATMKVLKKDEKPDTGDDVHFCKRLNCQITTKDFAGPVKPLSYCSFESYVLYKNGDPKAGSAGSFRVSAMASYRSRASQVKQMKQEAAGDGDNITQCDEVTLFSREALRIHIDRTKRGPHAIVDEIVIWDDDVTWTVESDCFVDDAKGKEALFVDAVESFKLLNDLPAKVEPPK